MTFLGWLSDPFKGLSDLQLGDEKGTLNHLVSVIYLHERWQNGHMNLGKWLGKYSLSTWILWEWNKISPTGWYPGNSRVFPFQKSYMLSAQTSCEVAIIWPDILHLLNLLWDSNPRTLPRNWVAEGQLYTWHLICRLIRGSGGLPTTISARTAFASSAFLRNAHFASTELDQAWVANGSADKISQWKLGAK